MRRQEIIKVLRNALQSNGIKRAFLFGSFARGEKYRDIDVAFDPPEGFSLLDLSRVANVITERTGLAIDLVTIRSLDPYLKKIIRREMVPL